MHSTDPPPPPLPEPSGPQPPPYALPVPPVNPYEPAGSTASFADESPARVSEKPWGFWFTLLWSLVCGLLFLIAQVAVAVVFVIVKLARDPDGDMMGLVQGLEYNGLMLALSTIASCVVCVAFLSFIVWVRGLPVRDYLGLHWVGWPRTLAASGLLLLLAAASDTVTWLLDKPIVPPFMEDVWRTAGFLPLLWLAVIVAAPLSEELYFRGFLYRGLAASPLRPLGAILLTSLFFAVIHLQYDLFGIGLVFVGGLFLGTVRWWTGSTALTILLHALMNLVATVEAALKVEGLID
jgi:membrane protease YdiL (CAAX protease family)